MASGHLCLRLTEVAQFPLAAIHAATRLAKVRRKGGVIDVIVWPTGTARLLPRLLKGRKSGPRIRPAAALPREQN